MYQPNCPSIFYPASPLVFKYGKLITFRDQKTTWQSSQLDDWFQAPRAALTEAISLFTLLADCYALLTAENVF